MIKSKTGNLIFVNINNLKNIGTSLYSGMKSGFETFLEILSKETSIFDIKIIIFKISYIKTEMSKSLERREYLK